MPRFVLEFRLTQGAFALEIAERSDARALALFGPSGSGKTTVIEAIAGLRTPSEGSVAIGGRTLFSRHERVDVPVRQRRVGYVPQDVLLFPHLDVRGNVMYAAQRGAEIAHLVDVLEIDGLMDRHVASLSGGERQRVAMARALASGPDVLLLDEPLAAVDLARRRRILEVLLRIRDELRVPLVYVAHSPDEVRRIADRVLVLDNGRVAAAGDPVQVIPADTP